MTFKTMNLINYITKTELVIQIKCYLLVKNDQDSLQYQNFSSK